MSGGPPLVPGGRTPEEREAARRQREAMRDDEGRGALDRGRGARPAGTRPGRRRPGRFVAAIALGVLLVAAAWLVISLFQPLRSDGEGRVHVVVPKGASVSRIGDLLERRGVVESSFFFSVRVRLSGQAGELKPGSYDLRRDMTYASALDALAEGPRPDVVTLTIPEGLSRREISRIVRGALVGDYVAATRRSTALDPQRYGGPSGASLEGFLFPATYEMRRGRPVTALVEQQLAAFERQLARVNMRYARRRKLTRYDVLIIGSMVEREAQVPKERRLIASVIYNRLRMGMRLGIDATLRFALNNWRRPLRQSELRSRTPYNTYTRPGLPPGPIGNPGLASIEAAARPASTRYLYYVVKPCGNGAHAFARTDAGFQRLKARYERARMRRGGRSPATC